VFVKHVLQTNDNALKVSLAPATNVIAYLSQVDIVQGGVNLVHDKERSRVERMNCKQEGERSNSLFAATKLLHVAEALHRWHCIEFHSSLVGLFGVVQTKVGISSQRMLAALCHIRVDSLEGLVNVTKGFVEPFRSLGLDTLESFGRLGCIFFRLLVVRVALLETLRDRRESFACLSKNKKSVSNISHGTDNIKLFLCMHVPSCLA
jgi:hypothetical protein